MWGKARSRHEPSYQDTLESIAAQADVEGRLIYVVLALVSCERPTDLSSGGDNRVLRLDNLAYDRPLHPLPHEHDSPRNHHHTQ